MPSEGTIVLIAGFPAGSYATNCYVVAPAAGEECVIVDPGQHAEAGIDRLLGEHRLKPVAVVLTHGHFDHIWSVIPVCGARDIPAYIHPDDRDLLGDPGKAFPRGAMPVLPAGLRAGEPDDVRELADGATLTLAGLTLTVEHAPGHTPGSVTFRPAGEHAIFTGDLLFAGSVGRTDLPGGDHGTLRGSLARVCLPLPDETVVLPGHGPQTTIGRERTTNPFLSDIAAIDGPRRGL